MRRITGQTIGEFVADEITGPLGVDFHIGTRGRARRPGGPRRSRRSRCRAEGVDHNSIAMRTFLNPMLDASASATIPWRRAEIPAAGGHGNARAVALVHTPMACGGEANGVRLLSARGVDTVLDEQCNGQDLVLPVVVRHGIGFGLPTPEMPISPNQRACFWGGWGGSLAIIDCDARLSFSYVMNKMGEGTVGDHARRRLLLATYLSLGRLTSIYASGPGRTATDTGWA